MLRVSTKQTSTMYKSEKIFWCNLQMTTYLNAQRKYKFGLNKKRIRKSGFPHSDYNNEKKWTKTKYIFQSAYICIPAVCFKLIKIPLRFCTNEHKVLKLWVNNKQRMTTSKGIVWCNLQFDTRARFGKNCVWFVKRCCYCWWKQ